MNIKYIILSFILATLSFGTVFAVNSEKSRYFNGPTVSNISSNSATVSISPAVLSGISIEDQSQIYFEYIETRQVCIMIYPTPENCLPKKTVKGQTSVALTDLKPNTSYTVYYKKDNTIACITTPCPGNDIQSQSVEFTTKALASTTFSRNLHFRSRGNDVVLLQDILRDIGYLKSQSTGYFGIATFKAVKAFQKNYMKIPPTGYVGPKTRTALSNLSNNLEETFEGNIQSVSTACFSDGECSVTIDGKKIVTTIGWSQAVVGSIKGTVNSIGEIETNKIGARAKVYAKKTTDGYTLYGNSAYYIEVL